MNTIQIEKLSHDGRGIGHINGKTVFVQNALVGEHVTIRMIKQHSRFDETKAIEIIEPSAQRVVAACPHFNECGGCSLQHMSVTQQIEMKQQNVLEQLKQFGNVVPKKIFPAMLGDEFHYRRKARLGVQYWKRDQKLVIGFRDERGRGIVDLQTCKTLRSEISNLLIPLQQCIASLSIYQSIPQIEVAVSDDAIALIIRHLKPMEANDLDCLKQFSLQHQVKIYLQPKGIASIHLLLPEENDFHLNYFLPQFNLTYRANPTDFVQVNAKINQQLVAFAIEQLQLTAEDVVLDLFCGLGNFSLPIAQQVKKLIGVEGEAEMVKRAQENAVLNQINHAQFYTANLFEDQTHTSWFQADWNKLLIDPPRSGAEQIIRQIKNHPVDRIVYISCNPATLARDLGILVHEQHYQLEAIGVIDMFTHTHHIETIAVLTHGKN